MNLDGTSSGSSEAPADGSGLPDCLDRHRHAESPVAGSCPSPGEWQSFLDGGLSEDERHAMEQHFDRCVACVSIVEALANLSAKPVGRRPVATQEARLRWETLLSLVHSPVSLFDNAAASGTDDGAPPELPGFHSLCEVGRGGSGIVYRGVQQSLGRTVAIKVLSAEAWQRGRRRIEGEARALARLRHPCIVAIHEFGLTNQVPYLVMEWVGGGSLQDRIDQGPLPVREVAWLLKQLAEAVDLVHALEIVHRDLKPANVLLEPTEPGEPWVAKLTDFGLAEDHWQQQRQSVSGAVVGTPAYMAPEQTGLVDLPAIAATSCDIYGLGAIAYAALTGQPPHRGRSTLDTLVRVASDEPQPLAQLRPEVPLDLATIVEKCLRHRPGDRYRTAAELRDDLGRFLDGRPISARSSTRAERALKWVRRRPAQATASGLLVLLVLSTIIGTWTHLWHQQRALRDLEAEKRKVDQALQIANEATATERRLKLQILEQLTLTPQMLFALFQKSGELTNEHRLLLAQIREPLWYHVHGLRSDDVRTAEVVVQGLSALSYCEEFRFGLLDDALADLDAAQQVAGRFPDSVKLCDLEVQLPVMRYRQALRLGRTGRSAEMAEQIRQLGLRWVEQPQRNLGVEKTILLASTLLELGHPEIAVKIVRPIPSRCHALARDTPDNRELWGRLFNAQILQAQLEELVGDSGAADATVGAWRSALAEARRWHPTLQGPLAQVEFELMLLRLARAQRGGDPEPIPVLIDAARRQIVAGVREGEPPLPWAVRQLRLALLLLNLPGGWISAEELRPEVEGALAAAGESQVIDTDDGVLKKLADEVRGLWTSREETRVWSTEPSGGR
jgi:serine/threonine protein kinase